MEVQFGVGREQENIHGKEAICISYDELVYRRNVTGQVEERVRLREPKRFIRPLPVLLDTDQSAIFRIASKYKPSSCNRMCRYSRQFSWYDRIGRSRLWEDVFDTRDRMDGISAHKGF